MAWFVSFIPVISYNQRDRNMLLLGLAFCQDGRYVLHRESHFTALSVCGSTMQWYSGPAILHTQSPAALQRLSLLTEATVHKIVPLGNIPSGFRNVCGGSPKEDPAETSEPSVKRLRSSSVLEDLRAHRSAASSSSANPIADLVVHDDIPSARSRKSIDFYTDLANAKISALESFKDRRELAKTLVTLIRYLVQANLSNYQLSNMHKLAIFVIIDGYNWRAHSKQAFNYSEFGAWLEADSIVIRIWDDLTTLEGVFIKLSEIPDVRWEWNDVKAQIAGLLSSIPGEDQDLKDSNYSYLYFILVVR